MKTYTGTLDENANGGRQVYVDGRLLDPRNDVRNHSPDGFSWGYGGSGPSQLALAILLEEGFEIPRAMELYQDFKHNVIAGLPQDQPWTLTSNDILSRIPVCNPTV